MTIHHLPCWPRDCHTLMAGSAPLEPSRRSRPNVIRFGDELDRAVGEMADRQGLTRSQFVREAELERIARAKEEAVAS